MLGSSKGERRTGEVLLPIGQNGHVVGRRRGLEDQSHGLEVPLLELALGPGEGVPGGEGGKRKSTEELHGCCCLGLYWYRYVCVCVSVEHSRIPFLVGVTPTPYLYSLRLDVEGWYDLRFSSCMLWSHESRPSFVRCRSLSVDVF